MSKQLNLFFKTFKETIKDSGIFCFMCRGKEYQKNTIEKLTDFLNNDLKPLKKNMIDRKDENAANYLLSLESFTDSMINELKMLIALKDGYPDKAWSYLISSQNSIRTAAQAHPISEKLNVENYVRKLRLLEKILFPPQFFVSVGFIEKEVECSICGKNYAECNHIVGRPYLGKLCCRIIKKWELQEVSIVEDPANKLARATEFTDNEGNQRNWLSWELIKEKTKE
jgi:hypothetical protein